MALISLKKKTLMFSVFTSPVINNWEFSFKGIKFNQFHEIQM